MTEILDCIICGEVGKFRKNIPMTICSGPEIMSNPVLCDECYEKCKGTLIERFKRDFTNFFKEDHHICPEVMLEWLEENC